MERWRGLTALVTGAASGIGRAITINLLRNGMNVFACDINEIGSIKEEIGVTVTGELIPMHCDLSKEEDILTMFENIRGSKFGGIEVCVNNAGYGHTYGPISQGKTEEWRLSVDVNLLGLALCTREALKSMETRGVQNGQIINLTSYVAREVVSGGAIYCATKHGVRGFSDTLAKELLEKKSKIRVTQISPGLVKTPILKSFGEENAKKMIENSPYLLPIDIASTVEFALSVPKHVQIHELQVRPVDQPEYDE